MAHHLAAAAIFRLHGALDAPISLGSKLLWVMCHPVLFRRVGSVPEVI